MRPVKDNFHSHTVNHTQRSTSENLHCLAVSENTAALHHLNREAEMCKQNVKVLGWRSAGTESACWRFSAPALGQRLSLHFFLFTSACKYDKFICLAFYLLIHKQRCASWTWHTKQTTAVNSHRPRLKMRIYTQTRGLVNKPVPHVGFSLLTISRTW